MPRSAGIIGGAPRRLARVLGELGWGHLSGAGGEVCEDRPCVSVGAGAALHRDHRVVSDSTLVRLTAVSVNAEHSGVTPPAWKGRASRRPS